MLFYGSSVKIAEKRVKNGKNRKNAAKMFFFFFKLTYTQIDLEGSIFEAQRSFNALGAQNNSVQKLRRRKMGVIIFNFFPSASKLKLWPLGRKEPFLGGKQGKL